MKVFVTIKTFEENMVHFNYLIPLIETTIEEFIPMLVKFDEPYIDISGLEALHFTEDYYTEINEFQASLGQNSFVTNNKIAEGLAQLIPVRNNNSLETPKYHLFFSKKIPMSIMVANHVINNKQLYDFETVESSSRELLINLRSIRHELAHVEDLNNQVQWQWLDDAIKIDSIRGAIRYDAYMLWREYYACMRSNFIFDEEAAQVEITSLLSSLEAAEKEICELRWLYTNNRISIEHFVLKLHEYIRGAFIFCCYFMGHMDRLYSQMVDNLRTELYPSRFYSYIPIMWDSFRKMAGSYPNWDTANIFDGVADLILSSIHEFEVYPEDTREGVFYKIPPARLKTKQEELLK